MSLTSFMGRLLSRRVTDDRRRHMIDTLVVRGAWQVPANSCVTTARYDCPCVVPNTFN